MSIVVGVLKTNFELQIELETTKKLLDEAVRLITEFDLSFQDKDWRKEFLAKLSKEVTE